MDQSGISRKFAANSPLADSSHVILYLEKYKCLLIATVYNQNTWYMKALKNCKVLTAPNGTAPNGTCLIRKSH